MAVVGALSEYSFPRHRAGSTAVVLSWQSGDVDAHGNVAEGWVETAILQGVAFDPGSSSEPQLPGQERVVVEPALYVAFDAPVGPQDRVVVDGVTFMVEGVARRWRNPFSGRAAGCVVSLRAVTG
jgi:hypothetical protein